mmetsp:Transcript_93994/g.223703  ORF Transcript_93994/g.223703 Transcript_93994/m.223703 type:complete len:241 (-) Transcript_93994:1696-2418(-)
MAGSALLRTLMLRSGRPPGGSTAAMIFRRYLFTLFSEASFSGPSSVQQCPMTVQTSAMTRHLESTCSYMFCSTSQQSCRMPNFSSAALWLDLLVSCTSSMKEYSISSVSLLLMLRLHVGMTSLWIRWLLTTSWLWHRFTMAADAYVMRKLEPFSMSCMRPLASTADWPFTPTSLSAMMSRHTQAFRFVEDASQDSKFASRYEYSMLMHPLPASSSSSSVLMYPDSSKTCITLSWNMHWTP